MGFSCPLCQFTSRNIPLIIAHLKLKHNPATYAVLRCSQAYCTRNYSCVSAYQKHLVTKHSQDSLSIDSTSLENHLCDVSMNDKVSREIEKVSIENTRIDLHQFSYIVNQTTLSFIGSLYANPSINRSIIQYIIESAMQLLSPINVLKEQCSFANNQNTDFYGMLDTLTKSFSEFSTEYKRNQYFRSNEWLISPEAFVVGTGNDAVFSQGESQMIVKNLEAQIIPLRKVLHHFLELPNVFQTIITYINEQKQSYLVSSIIGSQLWRDIESKFKDKLVLPLLIFFDDFEVNNPLGTHTGINKVGAVYCRIGGIPPKYMSMTENILLVQLHNTQDQQTCGNSNIFRCLVQELKFLESTGTGITINVNGAPQQVYFVLSLILGDNLGLHSIFGLHQSFNSTYSCRFCYAEKSVIQKQIKEDPSLIRDKLNYELDLSARQRGIRDECVFHETAHYHMTMNLYADVMHDLLEGICRYDMAKILDRIVNVDKILSLSDLNNRIKYFDYGTACGSKNLPEIKMKSLATGNLIISSSEMLCLVRLLGLMIGDLVPTDNEAWKLYKMLRSILCIVMNPTVQIDEIKSLEALISNHHSLYLKLFKDKLKPKFHFLLHYPRIILLIGPLWEVSCIRFEGKHRDLKIQARNIFSRRNICYSLAERQQLILSHRFASRKGFELRLSFGPGTHAKVHDFPDYDFIKEHLPENLENAPFKPTWVKINGTVYRKNMILTIDRENDKLIYGKIKHILISSTSDVYFVLLRLVTLEFFEHVHAFRVKNTIGSHHCVNQKDLLSPVPQNTHTMLDGLCYVPCR